MLFDEIKELSALRQVLGKEIGHDPDSKHRTPAVGEDPHYITRSLQDAQSVIVIRMAKTQSSPRETPGVEPPV